MRQNDPYASFRPALTAEQKERIEKAEKPAEEYRRIAIEEARKQLAILTDADGKKVILPDDPDICLRFPGVDPKGQYSIIDMYFVDRTMRLNAVLNLREERFRRQIQNGVLDGRMKLQNLGNVWEDVLPEFEILDAKTVEQEMNEPQKNAGGPEL